MEPGLSSRYLRIQRLPGRLSGADYTLPAGCGKTKSASGHFYGRFTVDRAKRQKPSTPRRRIGKIETGRARLVVAELTGDPVAIAGPATEIDLLAAFGAEWTKRIFRRPWGLFTALRTADQARFGGRYGHGRRGANGKNAEYRRSARHRQGRQRQTRSLRRRRRWLESGIGNGVAGNATAGNRPGGRRLRDCRKSDRRTRRARNSWP